MQSSTFCTYRRSTTSSGLFCVFLGRPLPFPLWKSFTEAQNGMDGWRHLRSWRCLDTNFIQIYVSQVLPANLPLSLRGQIMEVPPVREGNLNILLALQRCSAVQCKWWGMNRANNIRHAGGCEGRHRKYRRLLELTFVKQVCKFPYFSFDIYLLLQ